MAKVVLIVTYPSLTFPFIEYIDDSIQYLERQIEEIVEKPSNYEEDIEMIEKLLRENGINVRAILEYGGMTGYDTLYVCFVLDN
jgi:predicted O-methyltransferase YrrM